MEKDSQLLVRISEELHEKARRRAEETDRSVSEFIRDQLEMWTEGIALEPDPAQIDLEDETGDGSDAPFPESDSESFGSGS